MFLFVGESSGWVLLNAALAGESCGQGFKLETRVIDISFHIFHPFYTTRILTGNELAVVSCVDYSNDAWKVDDGS